MKREIDLVRAFREREAHRLRDLEPDDDPIREEKEYQDGLGRALLENKINFRERGTRNA